MKKIKIQPKHRRRRWDEIIVPNIKLEGKWLQDYGFEHGKYISIHVQPNKLILTLEVEKTEDKR